MSGQQMWFPLMSGPADGFSSYDWSADWYTSANYLSSTTGSQISFPHTTGIGSEDEKYEEKVNLKWKREDEERRLKEEAIIRNQFKVHDIEFIADLNINVKKWIQETWIICNRYRVGVRPQTEILASVFNHLNLDLDQINLSKSYVAKVRQESVKEDSNCIQENNKMLLKDNLLTIHLNTKLTSEITDGVNCIKDSVQCSTVNTTIRIKI